MKTTTAVGVLGSLAINVLLAAAVATLFSVTPAAQAGEVAHCAAKQTGQVAAHATPEHAHGGGHLVAVRMGWEAG